MCRSTTLSRIAHRHMWCNHQFSQHNKATERVVGLEVSGRVLGGQNLEKIREEATQRDLHKVG